MAASALDTNIPLIKVSFNNVDVINDFVTGLDQAQYGIPLVGIAVPVLVQNNPSFWVQRDSNGMDQLCTAKTDSLRMTLSFLRGGVTPLAKTADPFIVAYHDQTGQPVYMPSPVL